jgi:lipopolysaccharide export system permease protein
MNPGLLANVDRTEFKQRPTPTPPGWIATSYGKLSAGPPRSVRKWSPLPYCDPSAWAPLTLFQYIQHLQTNGQTAQKYEIQFWKKVFYPLSCLVMVVLALPFAYLHFRSGSVATYVFGGVMAGISFVLLNNVLSDLGALRGWLPWITAALPGLIYSIVSLTAFSWLVIRR